MLSFCPSVLLSFCPSVLLYFCTSVLLYFCTMFAVRCSLFDFVSFSTSPWAAWYAARYHMIAAGNSKTTRIRS
ncbi:MAG TPA: hypothetical protein EYQ75_08340 [Planctomycetaceae bacterium]|nr:hypothetical protein [Planctomycetaceae bacterium]